MFFDKKRKIGSVLLAVSLVAGTTVAPVALAAADNIEIILKDVTKENENTLSGEAKIQVSVKGAGGSVSAVQTALSFDGDLKYKSIEFLKGENNPPECVLISPNAALANVNKTILPSIVAPEEITFTDDETPLYILTFAGEPGDAVTVSLNDDSDAGTYCTVDNDDITVADGAAVSVEAAASDVDNEGIEAVVRVVMDQLNDFTVSTGSGYADSKIVLTITNEDTGATLSTVLNTVSMSKGGHYDNTVSDPTFVVSDTVVAGSYTVELVGGGFTPYKQTGVTFDEEVVITNTEFTPGDINMDGEVDAEDKKLFLELQENGEYDDSADINRNGKIDNGDDVYKDIVIEEEPDTGDKEEEEEPPAAGAPAKMSKPDVEGGKKKITVSWDKPKEEITGYILKYGKTANNLKEEKELGADETEYEITKLEENTTYYVKIAAVNANGKGEYSETVSAKTDKATESTTGGGGGGGGGSTPSTPVTDNTNTEDKKDTENKTEDKEDSEETFTDLGNHAWAKGSIYTLKNKGIINGVSATEYAPQNKIKRGDFILILTKMLSVDDEFTENFADVPAEKYYYNAIGSAKAAGIAYGSGDNFMPENTITRQDLITLAYRAFLAEGYIEESEDLSSLDAFGDKDDVSEYAKVAMASMVKAGIISGSNGNVNPKGFATRAEVAVMCAKLLALMD